MHGLLLRAVVGFTVSLLAVAANGQEAPDTPLIYAENEPARATKEGKILRAFRLVGDTPVVDGRLDEEVWAAAAAAEHFVQWDPDNGEPMTETTRVQVAYNERHIFVAIRCLDRTADAIARGLGRRDEQLPTDYVSVAFDPRHDHQTGYVFMVNPSGVQRDLSFFDDERSDGDYDAVWKVRTTVTATGWDAEYQIPFSQMRFTAVPKPGQVWGFSARRTIRRRSEEGEWVGRPRGEQGEVSRWGHLVFDTTLDPPRRLELQPYIVASATGRPAEEDDDVGGSIGVDARIGLGSAATLSATVNPDFGQVEQDPAVLNLTVFETFFPEKRPFFLEDSRTFIPPYGLFQLFHSRRIGRRPSRFDPSDDDTVLDRSEQTTIIGAAKLTGKGSGWTYGALGALTGREYATVEGAAGARQHLLEPLTSYNVVRVQRDVRSGTSNIGAIATGAVREADVDAFTGGVDYNLRWDRNRVTWNGHWVATRAPIDGIARVGGGGVTNFGFSRKHVSFNTHFDHFSRTFRVDDLGFFRTRANRTTLDGNFILEQPDPWKGFRRLLAVVFGGTSWNDDRLTLSRNVGVTGVMQFRNYWSIEGNVNRNFDAFDDLDTRGGPPIVAPSKTNFFVGVFSDNRKTWRLSFFGNGSRDRVGGWDVRLGPGVTIQPSTRLQTAFNVNYTFGTDIAQWISNDDVTGDLIDDHVYGTLDRHVVDVTLRSTYAVHRDMTVQLFLQPFVADGRYTDVRRLSRPRSFDFEPATLAENPDFSNKSLRGNVVVRWEYKRGSTMYVAWNLSTSDTSLPTDFSTRRSLRQAFSAPGTHAVLVKVSYWLSR